MPTPQIQPCQISLYGGDEMNAQNIAHSVSYLTVVN